MSLTILIIGGAGYIGSHTAFFFHQHGYHIIILDKFVHNQSFNPSWATVIKDDYGNEQVLQNIFTSYTIHAVIHCAAFIEVSHSVTNPASYYDNNVCKTITLLNTMLQHGIKKIIFSSSCAVYGNPQYLPLTEEHPKNPISPYGKTKLMAEMIFEDFNKAYGLQYVCLRYFNAAGALPEQGLAEHHEPETHLIPRALHALKEQSPFTIYGTDYETKDGTAIRDFVHVLDIAQAHLKALEHLDNNYPSDAFNLGTGHGFSIKEIIAMIEKIGKQSLKVVEADRRPGDPALLVADPSRAEMILKWKRNYSDLEYIIRSAYK